jgi:hypothetical protein
MLMYGIIGFAFLAIGSVVFFVRQGKHKNTPESKVKLVPAETLPSARGQSTKPPADTFIDGLVAVPARIYDNTIRTVKNEMLPADGVRQVRKEYGNLGRRWFRDGEWRYALVRLVSGAYVPVDHYMSLSLKNPPERLHRALQQQETATFYKPHDNRGIMAKYGAYLLFAFAVVALLFLWGANMMQGH